MHRRAFTLLELLIVIVIIAVLITLLVPSVQKVREAASRTQTHGNLMQLTLALHHCNDVLGSLPPATGWFGGLVAPNQKTRGDVPGTVHVHLLPFLEQHRIYEHIMAGNLLAAEPQPAPDRGPGAANVALGPQNKKWLGEIMVPVLLSAQDFSQRNAGAGATNFAANLRAFSDLGRDTRWDAAIVPANGGLNPKTGLPWFYGSAHLAESFPDGTSNTIAFTTQLSFCREQATFFFNPAGAANNSPFFAFLAPESPPSLGRSVKGEIFQVTPSLGDCNPSYTPHSFGQGGISAAFFDCSVRLVSPGVSVRSWGLAVQPNDGQVLPADWY